MLLIYKKIWLATFKLYPTCNIYVEIKDVTLFITICRGTANSEKMWRDGAPLLYCIIVKNNSSFTNVIISADINIFDNSQPKQEALSCRERKNGQNCDPAAEQFEFSSYTEN